MAEGTTVLLATQYMEEAEHLAQAIVVLDAGRIAAQGTADELKDQLGGNVLEVQVTKRADLEKAASLIAGLASAPPRLYTRLNRVTLPVAGGTPMTGVVVRQPAVRAVPPTLRFAVRDIQGITRRNLLRIVRTPQLLFMSVVQPSIILLLFRYVLGGAIRVPGLDYVNYAVPGIFLEAVLIGGMTTALALAQPASS